MRLNSTGKVKIGQEENILSLDVPKELEKYISSGIKFIDHAFGGQGLTPSMSILFTGTPGAGKTTLMLQMADSMMDHNCMVLYNTNEENLYQIRKVTRRLNLKHGFIPGQNRLVPDVLKHADLLRKNNPSKQMVLILDSLQTHDDGFYSNGATNSMTPLRVIEAVTDWCKDNYAIVFSIGQVTKDGTFAGKNEIKHAVDAHAHLCIDMAKSSDTYGERIFQIEKNRFGCSGVKYIVDLDSKGIREKVMI